MASMSLSAPPKRFNVGPERLQHLVQAGSEDVHDVIKAEFGGVEGLLRALNVDGHDGLAADNAEDLHSRETVFGVNRIPERKRDPFWKLMWDAYDDITLKSLTVAGVASIVVGSVFGTHPEIEWIEGLAVLVAVLIVVLADAINDYRKEKQFESLYAVSNDEPVKVVRDGSTVEISKLKLLVGDILIIETGDILPADVFMLQGNNIQIDESAMTGEADLVEKDFVKNPICLSGTKVMSGFGHVLVLAVGPRSQAGIIRQLINKQIPVPQNPVDDPASASKLVKPGMSQEEEEEEEELSPLQSKLNQLTIWVGKAGILAGALTLIIMTIRFCLENYVWDNYRVANCDARCAVEELMDVFITSLTIVIAAIPEGLPLAVTISLSVSVKKMLQDRNLVRHLTACETMGSATTICSDKTGTLTTNSMTVTRVWAGSLIPPENVKSVGDAFRDTLFKSIAVNSTADLTIVNGAVQLSGSRTECALLRLLSDSGANYRSLRDGAPVKRMFTFDSKRKTMSVLVDEQGKSLAFTKGAAEVVLKLCSSIYHPDGRVEALLETDKERLTNDVILSLAREGLRTLALAYKNIEVPNDTASVTDVESKLTLLAIVGIEDPVRPEVPPAITKCKEAGITVRMVTGDKLETAVAIAKKCGIIDASCDAVEAVAMEGATFRSKVLRSDGSLDRDAFDTIWPNLRVLARSTPQDKFHLVTGIKGSTLASQGPQVVAVTGDGTNDAPALSAADVGFAMGKCGTSVARDASDIVLMDDDFASIVSAIAWGRNTYDSVAKFVQFQLTVNLVAVIVAVVSACVVQFSVLTPIQLLWINLVTDPVASWAFATEKPQEELLRRRPYPRTKPLISRKMFKHILGQGALQLCGHELFGVERGDIILSDDVLREEEGSVHYTLVYNTFVQFTLWNELNSRKVHDELNIFAGLRENYPFVYVWIFQQITQIIVVTFGGRAFNCVALSAEQYLACVAIGFSSIPAGFLFRLAGKRLLPKWMKAIRSYPSGGQAKGEVLWTRGLRRLRTQLQALRVFRQSRSSPTRAAASEGHPGGRPAPGPITVEKEALVPVEVHEPGRDAVAPYVLVESSPVSVKVES